MKIYVDKKPETCGICKLVNVNVLDVMENREMVLQHLCPLLDLSVDPDNLDVNCPLIELKPKELEMTRKVKYETKPLYDGEVICLTDCPYNIDDNEDDVCKTKIGSIYCTESCRYYEGKIEKNNDKFVLCNYEEEK